MAIDPDPWVEWSRADQAAAEQAYKAADTAALLALLPVLKAEADSHLEHLGRLQGQLDGEPETLARLEEARGETLAAFASHPDAAEHAETIKAVGDRFRQVIDGTRDGSVRALGGLLDFHTFTGIAVATRERLARQELVRRGFLPAPPPAS